MRPFLPDDSGSMLTPVVQPGANVFAAATSTRWTELMGDTASIVQLATAVGPQHGVDVHFMNRSGLLGVTDTSQLAPLFAAPPSGGTPMVGSLRRLYDMYRGVQGHVLIILITDGEPSDGTYDDLFATLTNKPGNFYVSFVECNDNEEEMDYLTSWDTRIARFHNQEDYGEELRLVRQVQGQNTKFTRANYVQMIVLSPIFPKYAIDIRRAGGKPVANVFTNTAPSGFTTSSYLPQQLSFPPPQAAVYPPPQAQPVYAPPQAMYPPQPPQPTSYVPALPTAPPAPEQQLCMASTQAPAAAAAPATAWDLYCMQAEVRPDTQADLYDAVAKSKIVLLLDDSGSMSTRITPQASSSPVGAITTRWTELMGDTANIVQLVTSVNPRGVDVHFMNRQGKLGVTDASQLAPLFLNGPSGGTPMIGLFRRMYDMYRGESGRVLLILVTDGEPSDGSYSDLFRVLTNKPDNFYVSFVECNDNEEEMDYLTGWDTRIARFHNQEDYGEELRLVRQVQGQNNKFTRANYVQMIVLSPIYPQYAIDLRRLGGKFITYQGQVQCCAIL